MTHGGAVAEVPPVAADPFDWPEPVGECIGSGGFASVWLLGIDRVIKIAHASHELSRARIAREAEAMRAIGAPAVPKLHDSGVLPDGRAWIVMDRIVGVTLSDITAEGTLRTAENVALGLAILDALERVHAARFVHRDLKPDNLVRLADGGVVILDLGLARKLPTDPDDPTRANVQVGSLEYMPPEQIVDSANVDERTDIYAFGCVLYELLAGRPPFVGDAQVLERGHAALRPPRLNAIVNVPAAVDGVVNDCLAKDPARRPSTVAEVRGRLAVSRDERTPPRTQQSTSMIREGKQPVVLLWAELPKVDRALLGMLTGRRLVVASQRGRKILAGVLGGEHADPAGIAIGAARDLAAAGARVALHLEALRVSHSGGTTTLHGSSVDQPETWLPSGAWTGVVLTSQLASVTQTPTHAVEGLGEFRALSDAKEALEVVGREGLLTDLVADAAVALHGVPRPANRAHAATARARRGSSMSGAWGPGGPGFVLLVGDPGVGKTAFATELSKRLRELGVRVHFGTVPAPGTGKPGASALADLVGAVSADGSRVRAIGDALRAAARQEPTAVVLDDLHLADHELFDVLEYATLGGEALPLWVIGIASPRIDARRPNLGARAERRRRDVLPALDEDAAIAMTAALLRPAEYPPLRALRRLVEMAHGNPLHLVMFAREIHQRGAVRERAGGAHFLDTSALDELSPAALGPWLAARELAGLGVELVALARLCSVLGGEVTRDDLVAIVDAVERSGGAATPIDVDVGLRELVSSGILEKTAHGYGFRQALVEEGVYATTNEEERLALHRTALATLAHASLEDISTAERVAHHADAIGDHAIAARAYAALGRRGHREHRSVDADQAWSGALRHLPTRDQERARSLLGRARGRYRMQRVRDALVDLDEVLSIARELPDAGLELEAELERATALDWADDFDASGATAAHARALYTLTPNPALAVDVDLAEARSLFRAQQFAEAEPRLRAVRIAAHAQGHHDAEIIAGLLHATVLVDLGRYAEATGVFDELIPLCMSREDRLHLGAAFANRSWLWSVQGEIARCDEDLRRVIQLAREIGQASLERIATYNLAEAQLWQGSLDEALQLARRSASLQLAHGEGAAKLDQFLIARVLAARGDKEELRAVVVTLEGDAMSPAERATLDILACVADSADAARWHSVLAATAQHLTAENRLELSQLALREGMLPPELRGELAALKAAHALWSRLPGAFL